MMVYNMLTGKDVTRRLVQWLLTLVYQFNVVVITMKKTNSVCFIEATIVNLKVCLVIIVHATV